MDDRLSWIVRHSIMLKVTWRHFDQSAKQLVVGRTTIKYDDLWLKMSLSSTAHEWPCFICFVVWPTTSLKYDFQLIFNFYQQLGKRSCICSHGTVTYDVCIRICWNPKFYFSSEIYFNCLNRYLFACELSFTFCDFDTVAFFDYKSCCNTLHVNARQLG